MNRESEDYSIALDRAMDLFAEIKTDLPIFPDKLNEKEQTAAIFAIEQLNKDMTLVRNKIGQRKRDIYGEFTTAFNSKELDN